MRCSTDRGRRHDEDAAVFEKIVCVAANLLCLGRMLERLGGDHDVEELEWVGLPRRGVAYGINAWAGLTVDADISRSRKRALIEPLTSRLPNSQTVRRGGKHLLMYATKLKAPGCMGERPLKSYRRFASHL